MRLVLAVFLLPLINGDDFTFPAPCIEILFPKGLRISIPDVEGSTLFAVHIKINEEFEGGLEAGHIARDVVIKKNGRWTFYEKHIRFKTGDRIYFWLYLIVDGLGKQLLNQEYVVTNDRSSCGTSTPLSTATTEDPPQIDIRTKCSKYSETQFNGVKICPGQIIFQDDFSKRMDHWAHEVQFSDAPESDFTIWTKDHGTDGLSGNRLFIKPKLLEEISNASFIGEGTLELKGCTSRLEKSCKRCGSWWSILPPVMSSRLTTKHSFSFLYGEVEVRARLPVGDWMVPELWLESKEVAYGAQSGRMFLGKAVGNPSLKDSQNNEIGGKLLQQGFSLSPKRVRNFQKKSGTPWSSDYHVYKLRWAPDSISFFVDGEELGRVAPREDNPLNKALEGGTPLAPFDREFYLNLGVHVGGREDFPDGSVSGGKPKPWENDKVKHTLDFWRKKDDWYPTWETPHNQLTVDYVKVTAL
uniref:Beta-1,3-glucan-binding protein n=1 Tax=Lygus hesperus TaxID=30085 RepID=A0A146KLX9_LYGHE